MFLLFLTTIEATLREYYYLKAILKFNFRGHWWGLLEDLSSKDRDEIIRGWFFFNHPDHIDTLWRLSWWNHLEFWILSLSWAKWVGTWEMNTFSPIENEILNNLRPEIKKNPSLKWFQSYGSKFFFFFLERGVERTHSSWIFAFADL